MKATVIVAVIALLVIGTIADATEEKQSDVIVLTSSNFDELTKSGDWFLDFYAPWCGHCKKLAPTYDQVATTLKGKVNVAKIDCTVETELCSRHGVRGYPTIKFLHEGKLHDYKEARTLDAFVKYSEGGYAAPPAEPKAAAPAAPIPPPAPAAPAAAPAVGEAEASDVIVLTDANFDELTGRGTWLVDFYAPWCGHCKKLAPTYEQLATQLKGKVAVAKLDCTVNTATSSRFAIRGYPTIKLLVDGQVRDYQGGRTLEALSEFALGGFATAASAPVPPPAAAAPAPPAAAAAAPAAAPAAEAAAPAEGPSDVVVLTEENFDALTASGAWLLEFYAPWCGHCKKLAPTYEQVATKLKGSVNVGKIDCTVQKNLGTRFGIRGYPTIKYLNEGQVRDYKGDRSVDSFVRYTTSEWQTADATPLPSAR